MWEGESGPWSRLLVWWTLWPRFSLPSLSPSCQSLLLHFLTVDISKRCHLSLAVALYPQKPTTAGAHSTHTPHSLVEQFRYLIWRFLYVRLFALLWLAFFPYFPPSFDYNMVRARSHIQPLTPRPRKSEMNRFLSASCRQTPDSVCITEEVWRITRNWHYDRRSSAKCVMSLRLGDSALQSVLSSFTTTKCH